MKEFIRRWLGITEIQTNQYYHAQALAKVFKKVDNIDAFTPALGRIVAKLDPMYGTAEDDPARRKASDELGEATIKRLKAEDWARKHTLGEV